VATHRWSGAGRTIPHALDRPLNRIVAAETARMRVQRQGQPKASELTVPSGSARRELAVADRVLAERRELAITAARIAPAAYITKELGERPSDPAKRQAWDRGVAQIERYRQEHGVRDPNKAFGREGKRGAERAPRGGAATPARGSASSRPRAACGESASTWSRAGHRAVSFNFLARVDVRQQFQIPCLYPPSRLGGWVRGPLRRASAI
jgi:hypothetical protein